MSLKEKILNTRLAEGQAALFYTGQLGFLVKYAGKYILIDGYLSDSVDRLNHNAPDWTRNYPVPLNPRELDFVDYVFCTHAHMDHTDPDTLAAIEAVNKTALYIAPGQAAQVIAGLGIAPARIHTVETDRFVPLCPEIGFTAIPAAHEELHKDAAGAYAEVGFIIQLGEMLLYHSGDCCPYPGLEERIKGVKAAIMPINGRDYFRAQENDIIGNFDCVEAITLAARAGVELLIPGHYDLYEANGLNPAIFVDHIRRMNPAQGFHLFAPGERYILA